MPKWFRDRKKADATIPKWGRSEQDVQRDMGPRQYATDVPLGNTDPTIVQGTLYGGMPNRSRVARGNLRQFRGKYT